LPLQLRQASSSIEIGTASQNTSPTVWVDRAGSDLKRDLLIEVAFCGGVEECHIRALQLGPTGQLPYLGSASGRLATIDDGSTRLFLICSEEKRWRHENGLPSAKEEGLRGIHRQGASLALTLSTLLNLT